MILVWMKFHFFHYKKWMIDWHKKFFKNIHALYSFNPSSSADIFKFMFQDSGEYSSILSSRKFLRETGKLKEFEISLI